MTPVSEVLTSTKTSCAACWRDFADEAALLQHIAHRSPVCLPCPTLQDRRSKPRPRPSGMSGFCRPSIMLATIDLLAALDKELAQLDSDYLHGLISATETIRIRLSFYRTVARIESVLGFGLAGSPFQVCGRQALSYSSGGGHQAATYSPAMHHRCS